MKLLLSVTGIAGEVSGNGHSDKLAEMFRGKLKIDDLLVRTFLTPGEWQSGEIDFEIFKAPAGVSDGEIIAALDPQIIDRNRIFLALQILQSRNGSVVLNIPHGEEEVEVILGYTEDGCVVYLEHELEGGKDEEYHLHIRPQKTKWKRSVSVFVVK